MMLATDVTSGQCDERNESLPAKVIFLGTGAADIRTPGECKCENCTYIRDNGGRNRRGFSSLFVSPGVVIDYSTAGRESLRKNDIEPGSIHYLIFTHSHGDHCDPVSVVELALERARSAEGKLQVFGNEVVINKIQDYLIASKSVDCPACLVTLKPYQEISAGSWKVKPLPANHDPNEDCLLYLLKSGNKAVFYATDSTWFPSGTFRALKGEKLDIAILEGTFGDQENTDFLTGHMNFGFDKLIKKYLTSEGILKEHGIFALTHLSLHWCDPHDKLVDKMADEDIIIPYDGQQIELQ